MQKNIFYQTKKNLFKYAILPILGIMASCSLSKEFAEDDLYYSSKDDIQKTEIAYLDSLKNQGVKVDTLEIETIQDLNYAVRSGADATIYWRNYFDYSPYSSSLGWDFDGDGIVNAFDLHPYSYDLFDDINNNGISDALEFGYFFPTTLDFVYLDLYYNYPSWRYNYYNYSYWDYPWHKANNYYFDYYRDYTKPFQRRQRTLATRVGTQTETGVKKSERSNTIRITNQEETTKRIRSEYIRPNTNYNSRIKSTTKERTNTNYNPRTNIRTQNTLTTRNTYTNSNRSQNTSTRSSGSTVRSSSGSSNSSGSSTRSSSSSSGSSRSSGSSSRSGRR